MIRLAPVLLAASAFVSSGWIPNPHPHAIRDAQDAIATASAIFKAEFPQSGADNENWQREFTAQLSNGVWILRQKTPDHRGATIILDAKDGHIISAVIVE